MKFSAIVFLLLSCAAVAQPAAAAKPAGLPAGAQEVQGGRWRWVDPKDGKVWVYQRNPFGWMREEESKEKGSGVMADVKPPESVPKDAQRISSDTFRAVDSTGKAWLYKVHPSGVMKVEEPKAAETEKQREAEAAAQRLMSVKEEGENLRFSKPGPFGRYTWLKKKTELNEDETAVWEREKNKLSGSKKE